MAQKNILGVSITAPGVDRLAIAISTVPVKIRDWNPLWEDVKDAIRENEKRQFASEGGPRPWAKLSPRYAEQKRRKYGNKPILVATGAMRSAMTNDSYPMAVRVTNGPQFVYGTDGVEYASFHQSGTSKMPQRRVVDWDSQVKRDIAKALRRHVDRTLDATGAALLAKHRARAGDIRGEVVPDG